MDNDTLRRIITDLYAHILTLYDMLDIKPDTQKFLDNRAEIAKIVDNIFEESDEDVSLHTVD